MKKKDKKDKAKWKKKKEEEEHFVHRNDVTMSLLEVWQLVTTYFLRLCAH